MLNNTHRLTLCANADTHASPKGVLRTYRRVDRHVNPVRNIVFSLLIRGPRISNGVNRYLCLLILIGCWLIPVFILPTNAHGHDWPMWRYNAASIWPFMGTFIHAIDAETGDAVWTNSGSGATYLIWLGALSWTSFKGSSLLGAHGQRTLLLICSVALLAFGLFFVNNSGSILIRSILTKNQSFFS